MDVVACYYGSEILLRGDCSVCQGQAFLLDGRLQCCDAVPSDLTLVGSKRESLGASKRGRISVREREAMMTAQRYSCYWCGYTFWSLYTRDGGKLRALTPQVDHNIPFSFSSDSHPANLVMACLICNHLKSNKMFETERDAQQFLLAAWERNAYKVHEENQRIRVLPKLQR